MKKTGLFTDRVHIHYNNNQRSDYEHYDSYDDAPTDKQVAYAEQIAKRLGVIVPNFRDKGAYSEWIDENKDKQRNMKG